GGFVPGAKITLKNETTGVDRNTNTNEAGYYVFTSVPPGFYSLSAEAKGFKRYETTHNKLDPNSTVSIEVNLQVGAATEMVEVVASAQVIQTESAAVQKLITREQIDMMELNGRNPVGLVGLLPGVRGGTAASLTAFLSQGPANINGSRNPENLILFD